MKPRPRGRGGALERAGNSILAERTACPVMRWESPGLVERNVAGVYSDRQVLGSNLGK